MIHRKSRIRGISAISLFLTLASTPALSQTLPATMQGDWRWTRTFEIHDSQYAGSCIVPSFDAPIQIQPGFLRWGGQYQANPHLETRTVVAARYARKHFDRGQADLEELDIRSSTISVTSIGQPWDRGSNPIDLIIQDEPGRLIIEKCGIFSEVVPVPAR